MIWLVISTSLILAGIILERSNLLISSHSFFTKEKIGIYSLIIAFSIVLLVLWTILTQIRGRIFFRNKIFLVINAVILGSILIILLGIIYPIISNFYDHNISIGATFYNIIIVPLWIITYLGLLFHLKNRKTSVLFFILGVLLSLYLRMSYPLSLKDTILSLLICGTSLSVSSSLLVSLSGNFTVKKISTTLIHISIAILMISWLSISMYSQEQIIDLKLNTPTMINNKIYILKDVKIIPYTNKITGVKKKQIYTIVNVMKEHTHTIYHILKPSLLKENKGTGWQITNTNPDTILTPVSNTYMALVNDVNNENQENSYSFRIYQHYLFSAVLGAFFLFFMGLVLYASILVTEIFRLGKTS